MQILKACTRTQIDFEWHLGACTCWLVLLRAEHLLKKAGAKCHMRAPLSYVHRAQPRLVGQALHQGFANDTESLTMFIMSILVVILVTVITVVILLLMISVAVIIAVVR